MLAIIVVLAALSATPAPAGPPSASPPPLSDAQRSAYERGQSYERVILANGDRKWFGIALLHPVFAADLSAFDSGKDFPAGDDALTGSLRLYLESGDASALPAELAEVNSFDPYADKPPADKPDWWFTEAGMADADVRGAAGNYALEALAAFHSAWLRDHSSLGPGYRNALGLAVPDPTKLSVMDLEPRIESVFEHADSAKPFVAVTYPRGAIGLARFGVSTATISEMIDSPSLLAQPQAQAFVDSFVVEMRSVAGSSISAAQVAGFRKALVVDDKFDHDAALDAATKAMGATLRGLPLTDKRRFLVGLLAAQAPYNAFSLKDMNAAGQQLGALGQFDDLDAADPAVHDLRMKVATIPGGDWPSVIKLGRALVDEIETHS
ncbi:MAG TPA: hypothetical protein VID24_07985 [Candidatus Eremiobacteraceae bacterium]|jgi:hypothetical protein